MIPQWMKMLLAILLGNVIYFAIAPRLPNYLHHNLFTIDPGMTLDLLICVGVYLVILLVDRRRPTR